MEYKRRGEKGGVSKREKPHMSRRLLCTGDLVSVHSRGLGCPALDLYLSYPSMQSDVML